MRTLLSKLFIISLAFAPTLAHAAPQNVILVTLDGVRWQEVFHGSDPTLNKETPSEPLFESLWKNWVPEGVIFGDADHGTRMTVANPSRVSLPGYQNIFEGFPTRCYANLCRRPPLETFPERILRELKLPREKVATFASWDRIRYAVESRKGATYINADQDEVRPADTFQATVNKYEHKDQPPWFNARWDKYTFMHAMHYLKKVQPRFLFLSFLDSDEWGHHGSYPKYLESLNNYDRWINELFTTLEQMGEYGKNTTVIITTDHGRGLKKSSFKHHAFLYPAAKNIWLYSRSPKTRAAHQAPSPGYTHSDIRPTIETIFGLEPTRCRKCGDIIEQIVDRPVTQEVFTR